MKFLVSFVLLILLSGCMVGPNYEAPDTEMPINFVESRSDETVCVSDEDLIEWWTAFNDPFLNELLKETIEGSFDYRIALEKITQTRALWRSQWAQQFPEIDFDAQATRYRSSQTVANPFSGLLPAVQNFFQLGFDAIWEIDFFGKYRRSAQAALDTWEATIEEARDAKITVLSEVANTYTTICSYQQKRALALKNIINDEEMLTLSLARMEAGLTNEQEVLAIQSALDTDRATLGTLEIGLKQSIYSLSVLIGRTPESIVCEFETARPIPHAAGIIPTTLPSDLLRRRPDIRSSERQLASATEQIGVAIANLFPAISLTGSGSSYAANPLQGSNYGASSSSLNNLFSPLSRVWGIGGLITWPVFDWGNRKAQVNAQESIQQQLYLSYQKTVMGALQEVEQALVAYFNEEMRRRFFEEQVRVTKRTLDLTIDLFEAGLDDYSQVLQAKNTWIASANNLVDSSALLTSDLIAIYKAMGGDW